MADDLGCKSQGSESGLEGPRVDAVDTTSHFKQQRDVIHRVHVVCKYLSYTLYEGVPRTPKS